MPVTRRLTFDVAALPFAQAAAETLGVDALEDLADAERARRRADDPAAVLTAADSLRLRERLTATAPGHPLRLLYERLVTEIVAPAFGGRISRTRNPTFRVQLAQTESVSAWHRDADITGRPDYITCWVPFVDTSGSNTLWVERDYGTGDHAPIPVRYGEVLLFDGALLSHGSVANTTDVTRVSMDFRFAVRGTEGAQELFSDRRPVTLSAPGARASS